MNNKVSVSKSKKKAKSYCIAYGCLNNDRNRNLMFFVIPEDIERRRKWLTLVDRLDLLQREKRTSYKLCSAHFDDSSINITKRLKDDAVPTKFLFNQTQGPFPCLEAILKTRDRYTQTQTTNSLTDGTHKRKHSNEPSDCTLKRIRSNQDNTESKKSEQDKVLVANNKYATSKDPHERMLWRFRKLGKWLDQAKHQYTMNRNNAKYKLFALNFHYSSPHAYRCLQAELKLPRTGTLNRLQGNTPPTFDNQVLNSLKLKLKSMPEAAKYCTICVGEITLKRNLYYNVTNDEVIGFHNVNGQTSPDIAKKAIVILLQCIYFEWNQPIAYAFLANDEYHQDIDLWINKVIEKLFAIGIIVKAIITDQATNFDKFAKEVKKVTEIEPYFMLDNNTKIYYIFDVPHLVKCIRNNLLTSDFFYDEKIISWDYITQLYKEEKVRNFKLIPKITDDHIQPNNLKRASVKLAAQTLSRSVAAALHTYIDFGKMSEDARPTAAFIETINDLFDILNSSNIRSNNKYQTAFRLSKDQEKVINVASEMFAGTKSLLDKMTGEINKGHTKSFLNIQISIESIKMLHKDLKEDGFECFLTRRLNQDNLKFFFGSIRQSCRPCRKPTPIQFQRAFSKQFFCNLSKSSPYENSEMNISDLLQKAEDMMKITVLGTDSPSLLTSAVALSGETDYRMELPDEHTLTYVSAYLFFKCVHVHKCPNLEQVLKTVQDLDETKLFSRYKAYNNQSRFYGALKMPPNEFNRSIQTLENLFILNFEELILNKPGGELLKFFESIPFQTPCFCFPINFLLKLFIRFRIFAAIKLNNRQFKDDQKGTKEIVNVRLTL